MTTLRFDEHLSVAGRFARHYRFLRQFRLFPVSRASMARRGNRYKGIAARAAPLLVTAALTLACGASCAQPKLKEVILDDPNTKDSDIPRLVPPDDTGALWAEGLGIGHSVVEHLGRCRRLERAYLGLTQVSDKDVPTLARLPRLKYLDVHGTSVSDAALNDLAVCKTLGELDVRGTYVSERGVREFCARRPGLYVAWSTVASEDVRRSLVELQRMNVQVGWSNWGAMTLELRIFCSLDFSHQWDGDPRSVNERLRVVTSGEPRVWIHVSSLKRPGLEFLRNLRHVELLGITADRVVDENLLVLQTIGRLEGLDLTGAALTDHALRYVAQVPSLESLAVGKFSDAAIGELSKLPRLRRLLIRGPGFSEQALERCAQLPHLESLGLADCPRISRAAKVRFFAKHPKITRAD
jgi:hypothetical protein